MLDSKIINDQGQREYKAIVENDIYKLKLTSHDKVDYIVDIGANVGIFSNYANNLHPNAKIISLEPCREIFDCLSSNLNSYANIIPLNCAFGNDGYCDIKINENFQLASTVSNKEFGPIRSLSLFSLFSIFDISGNYVIKMDCEGGEEFLVNNQESERIIKNSLLTCIEVHFKTFDQSAKEYERNQSFKEWEFYNDWIIKNFSDSHEIDYYKSSRRIGYGHYSIFKK